LVPSLVRFIPLSSLKAGVKPVWLVTLAAAAVWLVTLAAAAVWLVTLAAVARVSPAMATMAIGEATMGEAER
jgi:flagellar biosynthesis protein FliQ